MELCIVSTAELATYLYDGDHHQVEGWLQEEAALVTVLLSNWQAAQGIQGGVAEVGVHHGKFFILLSLLCGPTETSTAIDVFDFQEFNVDGSGRGNKRMFDDNLARFARSVRSPTIITTDSLKLNGHPLNGGRVPDIRLFSVDGSHTAQHTKNDIEIAFQNLRDRGVVVVDDFYNPDWPGVQEGVHDFLRENGKFSAVAYGHNKLYVCRSEYWADYFDFFSKDLVQCFSYAKVVTIRDRRAIHFSVVSAWRDHYDRSFRKRDRTGNFGQSGSDLVELVHGWSRSEPNGTWMSGTNASAVLKIPDKILGAIKNRLRIDINVEPFVHAKRLHRPLVLKVGGFDAASLALDKEITISINLDREKVTQRLLLEFNTDEADSPAQIIGGTDDRPLSVFVGKFKFEVL